MKTLSKIALAALVIVPALTAKADWVSRYFRVSGTYIAPYYRTPANRIVYDNLSYWPSTPSYSSYAYSYYPSYSYSSGCGGDSSSYSIYGSSTQIGGTTFHNYYSSDGGCLSG